MAGQSRFAAIGAWVRRSWQGIRRRFSRPPQTAGQPSRWQRWLAVPRRVWQWFAGRMRRFAWWRRWQERQQELAAGLVIRKVGIKRPYSHALMPTAMQLHADLAHTLAVVVGVGAVPWLLARRVAVISQFYWLPGLLLGLLPFWVVYRRWQYGVVRFGKRPWDWLTLLPLPLGLFGCLAALVSAVAVVTENGRLLTIATLLGFLSLLTWLLLESLNAYVRLIKRPRPLPAVLSLVKSGFQLVSGSILLLYLVLVNFLPQYDTVGFLLPVVAITAVLGVLVSGAVWGWERLQAQRSRLPLLS